MRSLHQKALSVLACLAIALVMLLAAPVAQAADGPVTVTVLATSDIHGNIYGWDYFTAQPAEVGLAKISTLVSQERKKNPNILLIDNGDFFQGTPLTSYYNTISKSWKVHPLATVYNAIGYDAINLGNHEFNYGKDILKRYIAGLQAPVLSANTVETATGQTWSAVKPYVIKTISLPDGETLRIGIIGMATPAIPNFENKENYAGLRFEDQVVMAKKLVAELQGKVDAIVVVSHSGIEVQGLEAIDNENQIAAIAQACPQLSLIIAGHKHQVLDNDNPAKDAGKKVLYEQNVINGVPVVEPGKWGSYLSKADLSFEKVGGRWRVTAVHTTNLPTSGVAEDTAILTLAEPFHTATLNYLNTKIGMAVDDFTAQDATIRDTALIDLVNEVQRHYGNAQLAAAATFNPKAQIRKGDITLQDISALYIYENYMYTIKITGAQLRSYLEHSAKFYKQFSPGDAKVGTNGENGNIPDYNYDMVQGVNYRIDITQPAGSRIKDLTYQGRPVRNDDAFTFAINNYRFNGGGGFMSAMGFDANHKPEVLFDSQKAFGDAGQVRELIIRFIKEKGSINPAALLDNNWTLTTEIGRAHV